MREVISSPNRYESNLWQRNMSLLSSSIFFQEDFIKTSKWLLIRSTYFASSSNIYPKYEMKAKFYA